MVDQDEVARNIAVITGWSGRLRALMDEVREVQGAAEALGHYPGADSVACSAEGVARGWTSRIEDLQDDIEDLLAGGGDLGAYEYFLRHGRRAGVTREEAELDILQCCVDPDHDAERLRAYRRYAISLGADRGRGPMPTPPQNAPALAAAGQE